MTLTEFRLTLTEEERQYLVGLLKATLNEILVEEHRTRAPAYRELVLRKEALAQGLLSKLEKPSS
jgi:hypothetical protein